MVICLDSNIWDNRMIFVRFFRNQLWLILMSTRKLGVFSRKSKFVGVECLLLQDEHIVVFCVFTFRVDYEMYLCQKWKVPLFERRWTVCSSFKINTTSWVLHLTKNVRCFCFGCVLFILTMICFAFFWWEEWQVLDGVNVLGHFQHRNWLFGNAP